MDLIMEILFIFGDVFSLKGIVKKKHRLTDYIIILLAMLIFMFTSIKEYNLISIVVSILISMIISIIFGSITNTLFKSRKRDYKR